MKQMPLDQRIVNVLIEHYGELGTFKPPAGCALLQPLDVRLLRVLDTICGFNNAKGALVCTLF